MHGDAVARLGRRRTQVREAKQGRRQEARYPDLGHAGNSRFGWRCSSQDDLGGKASKIMAGSAASMFPSAAQAIKALLRVEALEEFPDLRVTDRFAGFVIEQVLAGNLSDILGFVVLGEEVIEGLVLARADVFRDREPPFLGVVEDRIDVENHAPEREQPVLDHLPDAELRQRNFARHSYLMTSIGRKGKGALRRC